MNIPQIQSALIEAVKKRIPKDQNIADILCSDLHISPSSAYKRLRGQTPFSVEEVIQLCQQYQISLDGIINPVPHKFEASFSGLMAGSSAGEYLDTLESELALAGKDSNTKVWYVTNGLPDFYYFYFDALAIFQYYIWEKMVWESPSWRDEKFDLDIPGKSALLFKVKRIANAYSHITTQEIWNEYVLDSIFHQLLYITESRLFTKELAIKEVCNQLGQLIAHLKNICLNKARFMPGGRPGTNTAPCGYFYNATMQNNIFILKENEDGEEVYMVFDNPNFIKSSDPKIIAHTRLILKKILRRSYSLNRNNEQMLNVFFDKLEQRWQYYTKRIEHALESGMMRVY